MKKNDLFLIVNGIISIILVALILNYVGVGDVIQSLSNLNFFFLALSMFFLFLMDLLMSYRIMILLNHIGNKLSYLNILKAHFVGMLSADFTPARSGYFLTAGILHYKYKIPSEQAMVSIFGPQIFDFTLKLFVGTIAVIYVLYHFLGPKDGWIIITGSVFMSIIVSTMVLLLFSKRFLGMFSFANRIPVVSKIFALFGRMQNTSHVVVSKTPQLITIMLFSWTTKSLSWYFAAKAVGITINAEFPELLFYFFLQPLVTMLEFIPTPTIAGLGLSEGGTTLIFSLFGIPTAAAATFALLVRFKTTFVHLIAVPEAIATIRQKQDEKLDH